MITLLLSTNALAFTDYLTFQARIIKPNGQPQDSSNVYFRLRYLDAAGTCVIYQEDFNVNMTSSGGLVALTLGSGSRIFPVAAVQLRQVFNYGAVLPCLAGGTTVPSTNDRRKLQVSFDDGTGTGLQNLTSMNINSVPYSWYSRWSNDSLRLAGLSSADYTKKSELVTCGVGFALSYNGSNFVCVATGSSGTVTAVTASGPLSSSGGTAPNITISQANGTTSGYITSADYSSFSNKLNRTSNLSDLTSLSTARSNLGLGDLAVFNSSDVTLITDPRLTNARIPTGTASGDLSGSYPNPTVAKIQGRDVSAVAPTIGYVLKWDGSAWAPSADNSSSGSVSSVTASGPLSSSGGANPNISILRSSAAVDGYLASTDFATFNNKLTSSLNNGLVWIGNSSNLAEARALNSSDITSALGYTPSNSASAVTSVASRTGAVVLSSADISGLTFGATAGTFAQGNDSRLVGALQSGDTAGGDLVGTYPNPTLVTTGVVASADYTKITVDAKGRVTSAGYLNSSDISNLYGFTPANGASSVSSVTASGPLSSSGGANPNISLARATTGVDGYLASTDFATFNNKLSTALNAGLIWVGNGSNAATAVAISGDATLDQNGNLTLVNTIGSSGTSSKVSYDAKGRITAVSSLNSADITSALGFTPTDSSGAVISVAGRTGAVVLSSADVSGLTFGTTAGTFAQGNDSRLVGALQSGDTAGGDLVGTYPNPTLVTTGVVASADYTKITVDAKGRVTSAGYLNSSDISNLYGYVLGENYWSKNASNDLSYLSGKVGIGTTSPLEKAHIDGSFLVSGDLGLGDTLTASGSGSRMLFYPRKAAFRAGYVSGTEWDNEFIGEGSIALGNNVVASNDNSIAIGRNAYAEGRRSVAIGNGTNATGDSAVALGEGQASGALSTAFDSSFSSGLYSVAMASGSAAGDRAVAIGSGTNADAESGIAIGRGITVESFNSVAVGSYNVPSGNLTSWVSTDPVFVVGNGNGVTRSNALSILKNGKVGFGINSPSALLNLKSSDGTASSAPLKFTAGTSLSTPENGAMEFDGNNFFLTDNGVRRTAVSFVATVPFSSGEVLKWNGSAWVNSADSSGLGTVTSVTALSPLVSSGGTTPQISLARSTASVDGYLASTDFAIFNNKLTSSLNNGLVWVGNSSNLAEARALNSTDITSALGFTPQNITSAITNAGTNASSDVTTIQAGNTVSIPVAGIPGRIYIDTQALFIYRDNGTAWIAVSRYGGDLRSDGTVPMTGNIRLNNQWLSYSGGNSGVRVDSSDNTTISGRMVAGATTNADTLTSVTANFSNGNMIRSTAVAAACGTLNFTNVPTGGSYTITLVNATASCTTIHWNGSTTNVKIASGYAGGVAVAGIVYTVINDGLTLWVSPIGF